MKKFGLGTIFGSVITCLILSLVFYLLSMPKKEKLKFTPAPDGFAVMIYDDSKKDYVESDGLPIGKYDVNQDKSFCVNGGKIGSYDGKIGKLSYTIVGTDECVVYFDIVLKIYLADNGYTFNWDKDDNASSYNIYGNGNKLLNTKSTEVDLYEYLTSGGTYNVTVKSVKSTGDETAYSNSVSYTVEQLKPDEPTVYKEIQLNSLHHYLDYEVPNADSFVIADMTDSDIGTMIKNYYQNDVIDMNIDFCSISSCQEIIISSNSEFTHSNIYLGCGGVIYYSSYPNYMYFDYNEYKFHQSTGSHHDNYLIVKFKKVGYVASEWLLIYVNSSSDGESSYNSCGGGGGDD